MCIREFELNLQLLREKEEEWRREREGMVKERGLLENERRGHCEEIESLKARLEELEYEMEFNENVTSQLKKQHAQKEDELYGQLESLEELYSKKI
jgi:chromosome segregation ATPase